MNNNPTTMRTRALRQAANPAECALWNALRGKKLGGYKFVRQQPIGPYFADFADFACRSHKLAIEVDGSQHVDNEYDRKRDAYLLQAGFSVLRLPSATVLNDKPAACDTILAALEGRLERQIEALDLKYNEL